MQLATKDIPARNSCSTHGHIPVPVYTPRAMKQADRGSERRQAVLFLCHHNAVRSQMAEALLRARFPHRYEAASAGTEPAGVHPLTILALEEIGVSTSELRSKHVEELVGHGFDLIVTVCGHDEPTCPFFPGGRQIHRSFDDPSTVIGSKEHRLAAFRRVRDEIDAWIREAFGTHAR